MRPLFFALVLCLGTASAGQCPKNYDLWQNGKCYRVVSKNEVHFDDAKKLCQKDGANLPSMHSADEVKNLYNAAKKISSLASYWTGLECFDANPALIWTDGSKLDFVPSGFPAQCDPSYGPYYYQENDKTWTAGDAWDEKPVICQINVERTPTCDDFQSIGNDMCVELETTAENWHYAEDTCGQRGAHLASIHTRSENDFIRRSAIAHGFKSGVHIGLREQFGQWNYSWTDGSLNDYENFQQGNPNGAHGDCFSMDVDGTWKNIDCRLQLPYFCSRHVFNAAHPVTTPGVCPTDDLYGPGDSIFSPGYPTAGPVKTDCEFDVTAPGQKAQIQFITFELNHCCDSLGIYDGQLVTILTGEVAANTTYTGTGETITLKYHSSSGAGVRGFHLKVYGAK